MDFSTKAKLLTLGIVENILGWKVVTDLEKDQSKHWPKAVYNNDRVGVVYKLGENDPERFYAPALHYEHTLKTLEEMIPVFGEFKLKRDSNTWLAQFEYLAGEFAISRREDMLEAICESILTAGHKLYDGGIRKRNIVFLR